MAERKYTVEEIDRMRRLVEASLFPLPGSLALYDHLDKADSVEDRLRTYMLNGTEPDELAQQVWRRLGMAA